MKIFEDREKKNKSEKEEFDYRQKKYEQNRANARERMRALKQFLKNRKDLSNSNEEFFEKNKEFFSHYGVKSFDELLKVIYNYEKENPEEIEKEMHEKYKKEMLEKYKKNLKIDNKLFEEEKNGFSIIQKLENKFENLEPNLSLLSEKLLFPKNCKMFIKNLEKCQEIKELKIIPDMKKYMEEKIKSYEINNLNKENLIYIGKKKSKYNPDTELFISSKEINIFFEKQQNIILSKGENYTENGIPINELLDAKIKKILGRLSESDKNNYEKVEQIINNINNKNNGYDKDLLVKNFCINCDSIFDNENPEENSFHREHNYIQIDKNLITDVDEELNIDINELDYNASLNKLYEHLKKEQNKVLKYGKKIVINFYADLLFHLYEIIVNNNSLEDLNESIIKINELYETNISSNEEVNKFFKNYFLFYVQRITKLSYQKLKKIEKLMADLLDINNNIYPEDETDVIDEASDSENENYLVKALKLKRNNLDDIFEKSVMNMNNSKQLENEENKKYFLRLGLDLKFKYNKTESVIDLYNKAKEKGIEPRSYETFILDEFKVTNKNMN